jgi:lipase
MTNAKKGSEAMGFGMSTGRMVHWASQGEGAPVVALHGSASTGAQWRTLSGIPLGPLPGDAPDLAGYGRSGRPLGAAEPCGRGGLPAPGALDAAGGPVHLIGHSFGGAVALAVAITMPQAVRSLTLIEPAAFRLLPGPTIRPTGCWRRDCGVAEDVRAPCPRGPARGRGQRFIDYWNGPAPGRAQFGRLQRLMLGCDGPGGGELRRAGRRPG